MADMIFQPKGAGTEKKEGTILVQATLAAASAWYGPNYRVDTYVSNLPTTGTINSKYDVRFTGCAPCQ